MKAASTHNPLILALTARNLTVEIHHHSAYQIVLSNDTSFDSTIDGVKHENIHGFLIKPHVQIPAVDAAAAGHLPDSLRREPDAHRCCL